MRMAPTKCNIYAHFCNERNPWVSLWNARVRYEYYCSTVLEFIQAHTPSFKHTGIKTDAHTHHVVTAKLFYCDVLAVCLQLTLETNSNTLAFVHTVKKTIWIPGFTSFGFLQFLVIPNNFFCLSSWDGCKVAPAAFLFPLGEDVLDTAFASVLALSFPLFWFLLMCLRTHTTHPYFQRWRLGDVYRSVADQLAEDGNHVLERKCLSPLLSEVSPAFAFKTFQRLSDRWGLFLIIWRKMSNASFFYASLLQVIDGVLLALCPQVVSQAS